MFIKEKKRKFIVIKNDEPKAEIELTKINEINEILNDVIENNDENVLIDLHNIVYIDSSGLGALMNTMKKLKSKNRELGLLSISKDVLDVFTSTKIAQFFKFYKSKDFSWIWYIP